MPEGASKLVRKLLLQSLFPILAGGCLFSSNAPEPAQHTGTFEVWGLVYHTTDQGTVQVPNTWVRVTWMRTDSEGALQPFGPPDVQGTGGDGAYRVRHSPDNWVAGILVEALTCRWDPDRPDPAIQCCLRDVPTCQGCEAVWLGQTARPVRPGQSTRVDVTVRCGGGAVSKFRLP